MVHGTGVRTRCARHAARERPGEDARHDAGGAAITARALLVVDLEEARHEAGADDEADTRRALVGSAQRGALA